MEEDEEENVTEGETKEEFTEYIVDFNDEGK